MKTKLFFIIMAIFSFNTNAQTGQQTKAVVDGNHQFYNVDDIDYLCTRNSFKQDFITNPRAFNEDVLKQLFKFQASDSLVNVKDRIDTLGSRLIEFIQYRNSVKVYQSSIKVLYDVNDKLVSINGAWYNGNDETQQFLNSASDIESFVFTKKSKSDFLVNNLSKTNQLLKLKVDPKPNFKKVYVITNEGLKPHWFVDLFFYKKEDIRLLIDDNFKTIVNEISLDNFCDNSTVSTPHNGSRSFKSKEISGDYYSTNSCSGYNITAFDNHGNDNDDLSDATFYESSNSGFNSQSEIIGGTNVWIMSEFDNYLTNVFGRNSWDGNGGDWVSVCNTLVNGSANNASFSWSTGRFNFGRGSSSSSLDDDWIVIDIAGHEVSHGIDHHEGGLIYQNESGAIDEAFADCWGEVLEKEILGTNDWLVGADRGAIRSLSNPNDYGDPSVYQGNDWYTGSGDNGGVHTNSGVMNHFFYLLVEGGNGNNEGNDYSINGIGMDNGANLLYKVLTDLVNSNTNYKA